MTVWECLCIAMGIMQNENIEQKNITDSLSLEHLLINFKQPNVINAKEVFSMKCPLVLEMLDLSLP